MSDEQPAAPKRTKRTPEEIRAQREAMIEKRRAREASKAAAAKAAPAPATNKATATPAPTASRAKAAPAPTPTKERLPVTRREFLNLAWLSAMALLTAETAGVSVLFLFPNFKEGEFGGVFRLGQAPDVLPAVDDSPVPFNDGKFWLSNTPKGVYALYKVCTHLGCLYAWIETTHRFECPCHGSKFSLTGKYLAGPAPRSLDRFIIKATRPDGTVVETPANGAGLQLNGDETLDIDTGQRIILPGKDEV
ncbi:MAG: ubiquinol-cytochrome c reductase iron-sulfur subunit [Anaerolineae bacterium]